MARQGKSFTNEEVQRILSLLSLTDMTIPEIAARMGCSRSGVASVNRKFRVRDYGGLRATWNRMHEEQRSA